MTHKKLRVGVVFGSRSCEYEVSLRSATSVITYLDKDKYEIIPLGITKEGSWLLGVEPIQLLAAERASGEMENLQRTKTVVLAGNPHIGNLLVQDGKKVNGGPLDVIFPVLHGPYGEDGTIQGLLEMANIPYVGCGVLGSALGMDKEKMKIIFRAVGLPVVTSLTYQRSQWERSSAMVIDTIEQQLGYPCVVKPVNMGSSIGVNWANDRDALIQAIGAAAEYDSKIIIERGLNIRELSCAVLGNDEPIASYVGELVTEETLLDYNAKYINHGFHFAVPADIPQSMAEELRRKSIQAFLALDLSGLARVDFFLDRNSGEIYINEVNTMPGFTEDSIYPKLWDASGLSYPQLLDRLLELALERHEDRGRNRTSW